MVHPELVHQLERVRDPQTQRSYVLRFKGGDALPRVDGLTSKRERLAAMETYFQALKAPLLVQLGREAGVSVEDLKSSSEAIVTASVAKWRELVQQGGVLERQSVVEVLPDIQVQGLG
ncbi:hypothetical protein [Myxococcus eversor]|nr:hypothetical protein [Myxococcus eversor]